MPQRAIIITYLLNNPGRGRPAQEYHLTLGMVKSQARCVTAAGTQPKVRTLYLWQTVGHMKGGA